MALADCLIIEFVPLFKSNVDVSIVMPGTTKLALMNQNREKFVRSAGIILHIGIFR